MKTRWMMMGVMGMAVAALGAGDTPGVKEVSHWDLLTGKVVIVGELGKPLGTFVTIEGVPPDQAIKSANTMSVDTIDGQRLERQKPLLLEINGTKELPKGVRCVLRGYETGAMTSSPQDPALKADGMPMPQQNYHFEMWFEATQIKAPATLEKK